MTDTKEETNTITALDYLETQEKLEREAQEALPGKFEKCTFSFGYIRQPLYACKTCQTSQGDDKELAGMCYSCSMACHASHDLFELFPKRAFRCDCGVPGKFANHPCALTIPAKRIINETSKNKYNHNFEGRYCRCDQHYDPEKEEKIMYQCISCEDWFHEDCIGNIPDSIADFECYVCRECTTKYPFLMNGKDSKFSFGLSNEKKSISTWIVHENETIIVDDINNDQTDNQEKPKEQINKIEQNHVLSKDSTTLIDEKTNDNMISESEGMHKEQSGHVVGEKRKLEEDKPITILNTFKKTKSSHCQNVDLSLLPKHDNIEIFLQDGWRNDLCKCSKCMEDYRSNNVEYLLAEEKTYEPEEDEDVGKSLFEAGMEQLQRVDRVKALESLMAYKTLASDIKGYFESFKNSGKVVTKEDVERFFSAKREERNH